MIRQNRTLTIWGDVNIESPERLSPEQRGCLETFSRAADQRRQAIAGGYDLPDEECSNRATLAVAIRCREVLHHNRHEGAVIYGGQEDDVDKIIRIFGRSSGLFYRAGRHVERIAGFADTMRSHDA